MINLIFSRFMKSKWLGKPVILNSRIDERFVGDISPVVGEPRPSGTKPKLQDLQGNVFVVGDCIYKKVGNNQ